MYERLPKLLVYSDARYNLGGGGGVRSLLGGFGQNKKRLRLRLRGIALFWGGPIAVGLFARFLHLTAFLLCVPNTRVLTSAHMNNN